MWIKKSDRELTSEQRTRLLAVGLCSLTVTCLVYVFGFPHAGFKLPTSLRIFGVLVAGVLLLAWRWRAQRRHLLSNVCVCAQCHLVKINDQRETCACGGKFTPMSELNWLNPPAPKNDRAPLPDPENAPQPSAAA
jgi:hypothetical protein